MIGFVRTPSISEAHSKDLQCDDEESKYISYDTVSCVWTIIAAVFRLICVTSRLMPGTGRWRCSLGDELAWIFWKTSLLGFYGQLAGGIPLDSAIIPVLLTLNMIQYIGDSTTSDKRNFRIEYNIEHTATEPWLKSLTEISTGPLPVSWEFHMPIFSRGPEGQETSILRNHPPRPSIFGFDLFRPRTFTDYSLIYSLTQQFQVSLTLKSEFLGTSRVEEL